MALQIYTSHRFFLILAVIHCSSSFSMNLHFLYGGGGKLPDLIALPIAIPDDYTEQAEKALKPKRSRNPTNKPSTRSTKTDKKRVNSAKLAVSIKKTASKTKKEPFYNKKSPSSFCPCRNTQATSKNGLYKHFQWHHFNEDTQLYECPYPTCEEEKKAVSPMIIFDHVKDDHKFFDVDGDNRLVRRNKRQQK